MEILTEVFLVLCTALLVHQVPAQPIIQPIVVVQGNTSETCPADQMREVARGNVTDQIRTNLQIVVPMLPSLQPQCGGGYWRQVALLNTSDLTQDCPSGWSEYSTPDRTCGRQAEDAVSCDSVIYSTRGRQYRRVCGRAIGYNRNSADGFIRFGVSGETADDNYVDGLSVTYGTPRNHIWTFAAGHGTSRFGIHRCPCDNSNRGQAPLPPPFVGENYYCDSEDNGALWDGEGCTTSCCTFNSPPWFSVQLNNTATEDIELRICADQDRGDEDIQIRLVQIFIQ